MNKFTSEILPSGVVCRKCGEDYILIDEDGQRVLLSGLDIDRLQGILHPAKVHGKCTPDSECYIPPRPETAFEKAIKEVADVRAADEQDLKDAQSLMGGI